MTDVNPSGGSVASGSATSALGITGGTPDDLARQLYGYLASYLSLPEVGDILRQAALEDWSPTQLEAKLSQTDWWRTTSESQRQFDAKFQTDPGSVRAQIAQQVASMQESLAQQGVTIDPGMLNQVATESLRYNWSTEQTRAALDSELMRTPGLLSSRVGTDYKALAQQYGVMLSDPAVQQWAAHSISGVRTDEQYREYLVTQAKGRFQGQNVQRFLDNGGTVAQYFDPYKQLAAQRLGVNPDSIDLTDPKWFAAINARDAQGNIREMTLNEWDDYLKSNPNYGFDRTPQARQDAYGFLASFGQAMGKVAS